MRPRARILVVLAIMLLQVAGISAWLVLSSDIDLRRQLMQGQFWVLEVLFIAFVGLSCLNGPRLLQSLAVTRSSVVLTTSISATALLLVLAVTPETNRIYYDEHIYEGIAQSLADVHRAQMCNDGIVEYGTLQCSRAEYNKEPYGYPYLLSVGFRLFGVHTRVAHILNALCAAALVWIVFLIGCALFDERTGLFTALIAAALPQQLLWAHTAAAEPSAALMCAIALLATLQYTRTPSTTSRLWMVVAVAFAVQFRTESLLIVAVVALVLWLRARHSFADPSLWWGVSLGLLLCTVHVGHLYSVRNEGWGSAGSRMSLVNVWQNIRVNGPFYVNNERFPALFTILAVMGLARRKMEDVAVPALMFLVFWLVYLFFYAGSYSYGADVRFSLMTYVGIALLAGRGATTLCRAAAKRGLASRHSSITLVGLIVLAFVQFLPQVRAVGEESWAARADVSFAEQVAATLPPNSIVLTHNPSIFHLNGVNAAQMSLALSDPEYVTRVLPARFAGGIYLHWNAWCNYDDPQQKSFCATTLARFRSTVVSEYRERDYRFAFYRLAIP